VNAFTFFGGVPRSILYDNTKIAVARILGDGKRQRTRVFTELQSHYLFEDRFGRPGKGNDKGKVLGAGWLRTAQLPAGWQPQLRKRTGEHS
jgi:transposase